MLRSTETARSLLVLVNCLNPRTATVTTADTAAIIGTVACKVIAPVVIAPNRPASAPAILLKTKIEAVKTAVIVDA